MRNYIQTGGTRIGIFNATWPFAQLEISEDKLILYVLFDSYEFSREHIQQLKQHRGFFSRGLKIEHSIKHYNKFIVFWTFNFKGLKENLEKLNYKIS